MRFEYPLMMHLIFMPFAPSNDVTEEQLKEMSITQNVWEKECYCIPVVGVEGDIDHQITKEDEGKGARFRSWLLGIAADEGGPLFKCVERGNGNQHFLVTSFKLRHEVKCWIDKDSSRDIQEDLSTDDSLALFGSELPTLLRANVASDRLEPERNARYVQTLKIVLGNAGDFPTMSGNEPVIRPHRYNAWKKRPRIVFGDKATKEVTEQPQNEVCKSNGNLATRLGARLRWPRCVRTPKSDARQWRHTSPTLRQLMLQRQR